MGWKKVLTNSHGVNELTDVDTASDAPTANEVLKWNGTKWVPAHYSATLTFYASSLTMEEGGVAKGGSLLSSTTTKNTMSLIGDGNAQDAETVKWIVNGVNAAITSGSIRCSTAGFTNDLEALATFNQGGDSFDAHATNTNAMTWPAGNGGTSSDYGWFHEFKDESITDGSTTLSNESTKMYRTYANNIYYGKVGASTAPSEATIEGLDSSELTNNAGQLKNFANAVVWDTVSIGSGEYFCFACPKRLGSSRSLVMVDADENQNLAVNVYDDITITNANGKAEAYTAYVSTAANLGSFKLKTYSAVV